jgi:hypothetical protein
VQQVVQSTRQHPVEVEVEVYSGVVKVVVALAIYFSRV